MQTPLTRRRSTPKSLAVCFAIAARLVCAVTAEARVARIVIEQRQSPAYEGRSFGAVGQYEILAGKAYGELDPKNSHNTIIHDHAGYVAAVKKAAERLSAQRSLPPEDAERLIRQAEESGVLR
jgi:hypothetical protein